MPNYSAHTSLGDIPLLDMAVTPAVFYKFGRRAAEKYVARENVDPLDEIQAGPPLAGDGAKTPRPAKPDLISA